MEMHELIREIVDLIHFLNWTGFGILIDSLILMTLILKIHLKILNKMNIIKIQVLQRITVMEMHELIYGK